MKIEDNPAFAEKLPRICYVLGGEKTPLKDREEFVWDNTTYRVNDGHVEYKEVAGWRNMAAQFALEEMINNPPTIIRRPQFSDDEKALMRLYVGIGLKWFARDQTNEIVTYPRQPHQGDEAFEPEGNDTYLIIPEKFLPQITWENSPFDAAAYLESEESK